jgi:transposase-like protein
MTKWHNHGFKDQAVQKAFNRNGKSVKAIALELNIGYSTLQKWIREYKLVTADKDNQQPQDWSRQQQFQALIDTASMDAEQCSQYCRKKGIFPHHLDEWRDNFILSDKQSTKSNQSDISKLKKENAALQKELRRKEKALAETAALLVLQKKFQALLEEKEE